MENESSDTHHGAGKASYRSPRITSSQNGTHHLKKLPNQATHSATIKTEQRILKATTAVAFSFAEFANSMHAPL
jgi:hypothetical protein